VALARDLVRRESKLLLTLLVIVASVWIFLMVANAVSGGVVQEFDEKVLLSLRQADRGEVPRGPAWLSEVMRDVTSLGGGPVITIVTLSVIGYLALRRSHRWLVLLVIATLGGLALEIGLKMIFDRGRPNVVPHLMTADSLSFPSGHSMMSTIVYLTLAALIAPQLPNRRSRLYVIAIAAFLAFIIGVSRVYLGVHYPSDVLGGWSIGLGWATLCWLASWSLERRRSGQDEHKGH
jgi:undecaprenyl-diphosphatase